MIEPTPLAVLIETGMTHLGIDRAALGFRLGYRNPAKAAGRVHALCEGHITSTKSRIALQRLPDAIEVPAGTVATAVDATLSIIEERDRQENEKRRMAREKEDTAWRGAFTPHAVIHGERRVPNSITVYAISGGAARWLMINLDSSQPRDTFVQQALIVLPSKLRLGDDGQSSVPFFGTALGFAVNYSPDEAVRYDMKGDTVETFDAAVRPGAAWVSLGR